MRNIQKLSWRDQGDGSVVKSTIDFAEDPGLVRSIQEMELPENKKFPYSKENSQQN